MKSLRWWRGFLLSFFWHGFLCGFTRRLLLVLIVVLIGSVLFLNLGASMGLPVLFWHEHWWQQGLAGWSVGVLTFVLLFVGFLLDHKGERCSQWLAHLPERARRDLIAQLKYYIVGGLFSLAVTGLFAAAVWGIGKGFQALQRGAGAGGAASPEQQAPVIGRSATMVEVPSKDGPWQALMKDPTYLVSWWPFVAGVLVAGAAFYLLGKAVAPLLRRGGVRRPKAAPETTAAAVPDAERHAAQQAALGWRLHLLAGILFGLLMLNFVANALGLGFATPATALCSVLGLVALVYGFLTYRSANRTVVALLVVLLLMVGGFPSYKVRVPGLESYYDDDRIVRQFPATLPASREEWPAQMQQQRQQRTRAAVTTAATTRPVDLIRTAEVEWTRPGESPRPLVLVCVSGGGIRASVWSAAVLCELERRIDDFPYHVRMISGASGGMVGAGYYTSSLLPPKARGGPGPRHAIGRGRRTIGSETKDDRDALETLVRNLAEDSLSAAVKRMMFRDLLWTVFPWTNSHDRGRAIEDQWATYWDAYLDAGLTNGQHVGDMTFGRLRAGERAGWRPSLVYSPMLVEDGRRLLITNLELDPLTLNTGVRLQPWEPTLLERYGFYSRSGAQFALMFPEAWDTFRVVTAARLSASFPYVSPAAVLPTSPRRRVVDAGYYDNYGVTVAAGWLADCLAGEDGDKLAWLKRHVSGVLVLQIRDGVNKLSDLDTRIGLSTSSPGGRGFEWASTPVEGVLSARDSVSVFRNDASLQKVTELFRMVGPRQGFDSDFFATATVEFEGSAPLSWYLTTAETQGMLDALKKDATHAADEVELVAKWFESRRNRAKK